MRKIPILIILIAAIIAASCSKKVSEIAGSIPDDSFLVATFHPKLLFDKGQLSSLEFIAKKIDNEFILSIIKDPAKSGVDLNEYAYLFAYFIDDDPIIGTTAVLEDEVKFTSMINNLLEEEDEEIIQIDGYSVVLPGNDEAGMVWNDKQVIILAAPEKEMSKEDWESQLVSLFDLPKEESITSIVDFNDFSGKMKDMNLWFTGDQLQKILDKTGAMDKMDIQLPMELYNNYGQFFAEFVNGAIYIHSETHLSDDVSKATETFVIAKEELNNNLLKLAPGNDLLLALAYSLEIDKLVDIMKKFTPPEMDGVSDKIEETTGIAGSDILEALNGDFVIAVNGAPEGAAIPVEIMIGIGLDDETLQEKLMGTVENWATVENDGDFFMINANGIELYSGIVDGIWVITNASGYKDAVSGDGLDITLNDSKFKDYAGGSMGMYMNLDLTTYPAALQEMMANGGAPEMLELVAESLSFIGMQASNYENDITLKTAKEEENSLYTILQILEKAEK
jgi:archaellum component FlaG (FlaF/FlaG flagellin family)